MLHRDSRLFYSLIDVVYKASWTRATRRDSVDITSSKLGYYQ